TLFARRVEVLFQIDVVVHLFQWLKRLSSALFFRSAEDNYSRSFTRENDDEGR
ncbi:hypothetical protein PSYMO_35774, partial [Pseudomonas amygdali pv. mori str. 301020]